MVWMMVNNCIVIFMEYIFIKNGRNMNVIVNYDHIFPWIACSSSGWVLDGQALNNETR